MTPIAPHITVVFRERLPLQRGASAPPCESYASTFQLLFPYMSQRLPLRPSALCLEQLDAPIVLDFLASLETERGNSPSTRTTRFAAIPSCMRFVASRVPSILEQSRRVLAMPTKKAPVPLVTHLSMAERQAILDAPDLQTRAGSRARAMLLLCCAAGLRVSALLPFPRTGVTCHPTPTVRGLGKGRRERP